MILDCIFAARLINNRRAELVQAFAQNKDKHFEERGARYK
jgi:hypothetical protein